MLATDTIAPALSVPLLGGGTFDLASATPDAFTLVVFYRGLHCPLCTRQMEEDVIPSLPGLGKLGVDVVVISMDDEGRATEQASGWTEEGLRGSYGLPEATARAWGLYISKGRPDTREPAYFSEPGMTVVRGDGRVFAHWQQSVPFARPKLAELVGGLSYVVENDYPARGTA